MGCSAGKEDKGNEDAGTRGVGEAGIGAVAQAGTMRLVGSPTEGGAVAGGAAGVSGGLYPQGGEVVWVAVVCLGKGGCCARGAGGSFAGQIDGQVVIV